MNAITLYQPWAWLIQVGVKTIETRSWGTSYRGPLIIHASTRCDTELRQAYRDLQEEDLLAPHLAGRDFDSFPRGFAVAACVLADCYRMTRDYCFRIADLESACGNFQPGRFAWYLEEVRPLDPPIPARGAPGLWDWNPPGPTATTGGVYVDALRPCVPNARWPWDKSCHLLADSVEDLHRFAAKLGLRRSWFQDHSILPHYDLTVGMRQRAIMQGAREIDSRELAKRIREDKDKNEKNQIIFPLDHYPGHENMDST